MTTTKSSSRRRLEGVLRTLSIGEEGFCDVRAGGGNTDCVSISTVRAAEREGLIKVLGTSRGRERLCVFVKLKEGC